VICLDLYILVLDYLLPNISFYLLEGKEFPLGASIYTENLRWKYSGKTQAYRQGIISLENWSLLKVPQMPLHEQCLCDKGWKGKGAGDVIRECMAVHLQAVAVIGFLTLWLNIKIEPLNTRLRNSPRKTKTIPFHPRLGNPPGKQKVNLNSRLRSSPE